MSVAVRQVSSGDKDELLEVLERNLGTSQLARFEWRHRDNPAGNAWSWFVYDRSSASTVGMASVFPRRMRLRGEIILAGQVGDFVIDATHRSLGPAVLLQRATFQPVDSGQIAFCYDCPPHDRGMSTFVRLNMRPNCDVVRHVFLLRSDDYFERKLGRRLWTTPIASAANLVLRMRRPQCRNPELEISDFHGRFGEEFSELDARIPSTDTVRGSRSAADLNWRYRDDPLMTRDNGSSGYRVLVARRAGEMVALLVFCVQDGGVVSIVDLFGRDLPQTGPPLLAAVVEIARRENMRAVHCYSSRTVPLASLFADLGFRPRERAMRVVAYAKAGEAAAEALTSPALKWDFAQVETLV